MARYTAFPRFQPFDRDREFRVHRAGRAGHGLKLSGKLYKLGEHVDKTLLNTRRLRQLYERRFLEMIPKEEVFSNGIRPVFEKMRTESIKSFLSAKSIRFRTGWKRANFINAAYRAWDRENGKPNTDSSSKADL